MFFIKQHWKITVPITLVSACILAFVAYVAYVNSGSPTTVVEYVMPVASSDEDRTSSVAKYPLAAAPTATEPIPAEDSQPSTATDSPEVELARSPEETKRLIAELKEKIARDAAEIEELKEKERLSNEWKALDNWVSINVKPDLDRLLPELQFLSDSKFTGDNFMEYFPDGDDRIYYGEKLLELNEVIDAFASKLATVDPAIREEVISGEGYFNEQVRRKVRGEL